MGSLPTMIKNDSNIEKMPGTWPKNKDLVYVGPDSTETSLFIPLLEIALGNRYVHHISPDDYSNKIKDTDPSIIVCSVSDFDWHSVYMMYHNLIGIFPDTNIIFLQGEQDSNNKFRTVVLLKRVTIFPVKNGVESLISVIKNIARI